MSRKEIFDIGSYVHVCNRGVKKMPIYRQKSDLWRLLSGLFYFNSTKLPENWMRDVEAVGGPQKFNWPSAWGEREQLVNILAYAIMPNHFHLVLKEIKNGGISAFMHKFTMGYSKYINAKYDESGRLFQGSFRAKVVEDNSYLRHLAVYVMIKNPLETFPAGGIRGALKNFDKAYAWDLESPFNSLADYFGNRTWPIINKKDLKDIFTSASEFKQFAQDYLVGRVDRDIIQEL